MQQFIEQLQLLSAKLLPPNRLCASAGYLQPAMLIAHVLALTSANDFDLHVQVQETMTRLKQQMQESNTQQVLFPPLEVSVLVPSAATGSPQMVV